MLGTGCGDELPTSKLQTCLYFRLQTSDFRLLNLPHSCVQRFRTIEEEPGEQIGPHAIPIIVQEKASFTRAELTNYLEKHGIETRTLFASMPTQYVSFAYLGYKLGQFPNAEYIGKHGLHIGVHQDLGLEEMDYVLERIERFLELHQN